MCLRFFVGFALSKACLIRDENYMLWLEVKQIH